MQILPYIRSDQPYFALYDQSMIIWPILNIRPILYTLTHNDWRFLCLHHVKWQKPFTFWKPLHTYTKLKIIIIFKQHTFLSFFSRYIYFDCKILKTAAKLFSMTYRPSGKGYRPKYVILFYFTCDNHKKPFAVILLQYKTS